MNACNWLWNFNIESLSFFHQSYTFIEKFSSKKNVVPNSTNAMKHCKLLGLIRETEVLNSIFWKIAFTDFVVICLEE